MDTNNIYRSFSNPPICLYVCKCVCVCVSDNCSPGLPALLSLRQEDQEFKAILDYVVNLRPTWDFWDSVPNKAKQKIVETFQGSLYNHFLLNLLPHLKPLLITYLLSKSKAQFSENHYTGQAVHTHSPSYSGVKDEGIHSIPQVWG